MNNLKNILIIKRKNIKKQKLETNILKVNKKNTKS